MPITDIIALEDLDTDGAIRESADGVTEGNRADFLKRAGLGAVALAGSGSLMAALPGAAMAAGGHGRPPASFGKGDVGILNYALTLEYLEAAFYNEATKLGAVSDPQTKLFLATVTKDENAHVKALRKALGSKAVKKPKFDFKGTTGDEAMFQATALVLENTGVHAYSGQALNIKSAAVVKAAISILTIEARHASVIGLIVKNSAKGITPDGAFDTPFTAARVLKAVKGTGFIVS